MPIKTILDYDYGSYKGYFAENFVAQELISSDNKPLYCWQEGKSEIEFLQEYEGQVIPFDVKSGWVTQAKSLGVFSNRYQPPHSIILRAKTLRIDSKKHQQSWPLYLAGKIRF